MSDDWKPGDDAWCISRGRTNVLKVGRLYRVTAVFVHHMTDELCLHVLGVPEFRLGEYYGHRAKLFRKIKPLTDEERSQFLADLDTPSPVNV